jgi:hypothetical protein
MNIKTKELKIDLDDVIKLTHYEIIDYLIKRSADDINELDEFNIEQVAEVVAENYKKIFVTDFTKRYKDTIEKYQSMINQS